MTADLLWLLQLAILEKLPSQRGLLDLGAAMELANGLAANIPNSRGLREKILCSLSTNEFSIPLQRFSEFVPAAPYKEHSKDGGCPRHYAEIQQRYRRRLCCLILKTGLHAAHDELGLDASLATALLGKHYEDSSASLKCSFFQLPKLANNCIGVSLFEAGSTPQEMPSRQWRDQLADSLSRDAGYQQQHIIKTMGEVCRDLEVRCENAEQPFREEQARSRDLRLRLTEAETRNAELAAQNEEYGKAINGLKAEIRHSNEQADAADERSRTLVADLQELQKEVERTKEQATYAAEASSEAARQQDLTYVAIIKGRDKECKEHLDKAENLEARISDITKGLASCQAQEAIQAGQIERLEESLAQRIHNLETAEALAEARLAETDRLKASNLELVTEIASVNTKASNQINYPGGGRPLTYTEPRGCGRM